MSKPVVTERHIADYTQDPNNARKHNPRNLGLIEESIQVDGAGRSLLVDEHGVIIAGNGTIEAAAAAGMTKVIEIETDGTALIVHKRRDLTPTQRRHLALVDNRAAELATWDPDVLAALHAEGDAAIKELFTDKELVKFMANGSAKDGATQADDVTSAQVEAANNTSIKFGDLYKLGDHYILCGDSTKQDMVAEFIKATGGRRGSLMFTDPPYGVMYEQKGNAKAKISGDLSQAVIPLSFDVAVDQALDDNARIYLCGGSDNVPMYVGIFDHHLKQTPILIVWNKEHFVMAHTGYHRRYELIYYGWKGIGGKTEFWFGDRTWDDVWNVKRDSSSDYQHPTQKPVELSEIAIANSCPQGGVVYEPFSGSGSTLIGCARRGRHCRAIDIHAPFVHLGIARWEAFSEQHAEYVGSL